MPAKTALPTEVRPLFVIAREILADPAYAPVAWKADPYIKGMLRARMVSTDDSYSEESGDLMVAYGLSNLGSGYRGDVAKRVKAELKAHAAGVRPAS